MGKRSCTVSSLSDGELFASWVAFKLLIRSKWMFAEQIYDTGLLRHTSNTIALAVKHWRAADRHIWYMLTQLVQTGTAVYSCRIKRRNDEEVNLRPGHRPWFAMPCGMAGRRKISRPHVQYSTSILYCTQGTDCSILFWMCADLTKLYDISQIAWIPVRYRYEHGATSHLY